VKNKTDNYRADTLSHRRKWARRLGWILYGLVFMLFLAGAVAGGYIYVHFIRDLPDYSSLKDYRPPTVTRIFARDGRLMGEFYAERRIEVPYSRLPRHLVLAFVAAEDSRFFEHPGVDLIGIVRAFFRNLEAGEIVQGGSTITQQLVKRILLTSEKSFARKVKEAVLAYRIENYLTKEEILNLYLNHIFLGHGAYGVEAAAQEYFSKHVEDLTLAESAILAGIPKAPSRYSPYLHPRLAKERQAYVLKRMEESGFITPQQAQAALSQPLTLKPWRPDWIKACGYFTEHVRGLLEERFGRDQVASLGLKVYTTADVNLHRDAQEAIGQGIAALTKRNGYRGPLRHLQGKALAAFEQRQVRFYRKYPPHKGLLVTAVIAEQDRRLRLPTFRLGDQAGVLEAGEGHAATGGLRAGDVVQVRLQRQDRRSHKWVASLEPAPMVQGALFSMELKTGKVRTLIGGKNYADSTFNRAVQARRQPGSAFKPIIYAAAIEKGYGPNSILLDAPISLPGGRVGQYWTPQNYDHKFGGPIPLATALARSRNVPTVRLMMAIGIPATAKMARTLGITTPIYPNYASALGASEVTLLELTRAYSVFPNQGYLVKPVFIERVEDRDGRVLLEERPERHLVLNPETAETMTELLLGVVQRGTATRVQVLKRPIGGKTGTTNKTRDAWFLGFTPSLITGTWVGMDDERSLGPKETGSQAAAPIFISYMEKALKNQPVENFQAPSATVLAKGKDQGQDDEEASSSEDESFYPEEQKVVERDQSDRIQETPETSATPPSSTQQFLKEDMDE
jgi:penicillin-binding protein 1A